MLSINDPVVENKKLLSTTETSNSLKLPEDVLDARAVKYRMALADNGPDVDQIKELLKQPHGEEALRANATSADLEEKQTAAKNLIQRNPEQDIGTLTAVAEAGVATPAQETILEKRYAEKLAAQVLSNSSNPEEVSNAGSQEVSQVMYDMMVEQLAKQEGYLKILEDRQAKNKAAGWGSWISDEAPQFLPIYSEYNKRYNTLGDKMPSLLPGSNMEEQMNYLHGLPAEEAVKLVKQIDEEMSKNNPQMAEDFINTVINGYATSSSDIDTAFFALDMFGIASSVKKLAGKRMVGRLSAKEVRANVAKAREELKNFTVKKELANNVPAADLAEGDARSAFAAGPPKAKDLSKGDARSQWLKHPNSAKDLAEGDLRDQWRKGKPFNNRIKRLADSVKQQNATLDETLAANGYLEEATKLLAKDLLGKTGDTAKDGIERLLKQTPMLSNPKQFFVEASNFHRAHISEYVDLLNRNKALFVDAFSKVLNVGRIPLDLEQELLNKTAKDWATEAKQAGLEKALLGSIEKFESQLSGLNIAFVEAKWGQKDGKLFPNATLAYNTALNRYDFPKGTFSIVQEGDGYAIKVARPIDEVEGIRTASLTSDTASNTKKGKILGIVPTPDIVSSAKKRISGSKEIFSEKQNRERAVMTNAQVALQKYAEEMAKPLAVLSKQEYKDLKKIMDINRRTLKVPGDPSSRGKFFTNIHELEAAYAQTHKRLPTSHEVAAYTAYVQQSQMDYIFRAVNEIKRKTREGIGTIKTRVNGTDLTLEGKVIDSLPVNSIHDAGVFVAEGTKGKYYRLNAGGFSEKIKKDIREKALQVIHVFNPEDPALHKAIGAHGIVNYIVAPTAKKSGLDWLKQLPYNPGGHIKYSPEALIKQANIGRDSAGRKTYFGDTTVLAATSYAKAEKEAKLLERARQALLKKDDVALGQVIKEGLPYTSNQLKSLFKTKLSLETPISVVRSGEHTADNALKTINGKSLRDEVGEFDDFTTSPHNLNKHMQQQYIGERDGPLYSIKEAGTEENPLFHMEEYEMVDPFQVHTEAMNRLIKDRHYQDYQISAAESFVKEFPDLISMGGKVLTERELWRNPIYYLMNGEVKGNMADPRVATAVTAQAAVKNLLRHESVIGQQIGHLRAKLLDSAYKRWGEKYTKVISDFVVPPKTSLIDKMRHVAFHTKLGLFNPKQILLQSQTLFLIGAISPKYALGSVKAGWAMRHLDLLPGDSAVLDRVAKSAVKLNPQWTEAEFKESYNLLRQTGFDEVGGQVSYRNDIGNFKLTQGKTNQFLSWGATFFNWSERNVLLAAWNTAYKEYADKFPKLKGRMTPEDAKFIMTRAEDLSINMRRNAHSRWQEGAMSGVTQFWGYSGRLFDLYTGTRLTKAERARMIAMNSLLYGIPVGLTPYAPFWPWRDALRQDLMESGMVTDEGVADIAMNGVLASSISGITGEQFDVPAVWGPNAIQTIYNLVTASHSDSPFGELIDALGGASGTIIGQIAADAYPVINDMQYLLSGSDAASSRTAAADALNTLKNISTVNSISKIWQAMNVGTYATKDGRVLDEHYDLSQAIFSAISGIDHQDVSDTFLRFRSAQETQAAENAVSKEVKRWLRLYHQAVKDENDEAAHEYLTRAKAEAAKENFSEEQIKKLKKSVEEEDSLPAQSKDQFIKAPNDPAEKELRKEMFKEE